MHHSPTAVDAEASSDSSCLAALVRLGPPPRLPSAWAIRRKSSPRAGSELASALQRGTLVMFGATQAHRPGLRFRQDNDFFYLTGNESLNAVLVMDAATGASHLFLPKLTRDERSATRAATGSRSRTRAQAHGFASIQPLTASTSSSARRAASSGTETLWTRLSERDDGQQRPRRRRHRHQTPAVNPFAQQPDRGRGCESPLCGSSFP